MHMRDFYYFGAAHFVLSLSPCSAYVLRRLGRIYYIFEYSMIHKYCVVRYLLQFKLQHSEFLMYSEVPFIN